MNIVCVLKSVKSAEMYTYDLNKKDFDATEILLYINFSKK